MARKTSDEDETKEEVATTVIKHPTAKLQKATPQCILVEWESTSLTPKQAAKTLIEYRTKATGTIDGIQVPLWHTNSNGSVTEQRVAEFTVDPGTYFFRLSWLSKDGVTVGSASDWSKAMNPLLVVSVAFSMQVLKK